MKSSNVNKQLMVYANIDAQDDDIIFANASRKQDLQLSRTALLPLGSMAAG